MIRFVFVLYNSSLITTFLDTQEHGTGRNEQLILIEGVDMFFSFCAIFPLPHPTAAISLLECSVLYDCLINNLPKIIDCMHTLYTFFW